jgi:hypothetical protein
MALTIYSRGKQSLGHIRDYDLPLPDINRALENAQKLLESGRARSAGDPGTPGDLRNRRIVKAVEEILDVVIPSLQGAAAVLEDAVFRKPASSMENSVKRQVEALKTSIATAVRHLNKALDMKVTGSPEPVDLLPQDKTTENTGPAKTRISATKAIASARKHLQALHLPVTGEEEEDQASSENDRIAKTLDEVVFQTNLLTLNAAVEAYRSDEAQEEEKTGVPLLEPKGRRAGKRLPEAGSESQSAISP